MIPAVFDGNRAERRRRIFASGGRYGVSGMSRAEPEEMSLLSEVEGWDPEACRRQLSAALPRLFISFSIAVAEARGEWEKERCPLPFL